MIQEQLFFSIIIPTYNRPERLQTCLKSLTCLNYPRDRFEVIVVDDGSSTPLDSVVLPFQERLNIELIRQDNQGPATARNTGAIKAEGKFVLFTDDDCELDPKLLDTLANQFELHPDSLLGGQTINQLCENLYSEASQLLVDYLYVYYNCDPQQARFFTSNNFGLSKARFCEIGYFDTSFPLAAGEDRELCDRWLHHSYQMVSVPEALVYHSHHLTLKSFWRQHFNYGRGAFHFRQVRSRRDAKPIKVEPLSFYLNLLRYPFPHSSHHSPILIASLFVLSQIANFLGFFWETKQQRVEN
ncbi:glycosyltransferase family 2 protein [Merismopedia glauca]|uniref:Glycosyl transferase n=1 Tax=Merismopedia glauca CCAP 1448/3 TaxID=1296344 RepID=A0A2T1BZU5_9CYAN|nr:glycosyltransferase [Merismopedia glauca]PSB01512.1 glycosyl transferase [Merismopedia glauca CCAP 1448/3]